MCDRASHTTWDRLCHLAAPGHRAGHEAIRSAPFSERPMMHVRTIQAADTYALRLLVLRPGGTLKDADYANDSASATFHLGAESDGRIISVGSFYAEERAEVPGSKQYSLRGMANQ